MAPEAFISHASSGRLRIKIPSMRGQESALVSCGERCAACAGVESVAANPMTGSLLVLHRTTGEAIIEYARSQSLFDVAEQGRVPSANPGNFRKDLRKVFRDADKGFQRLTGGEMDLGGLSVVVLAGAGVVQILEGNAGALPWYGAFWYAFNIFLKSKESE